MGRTLDDLGLDVVDGRVDLRGLHTPRPVVMLTGVGVQGLDLRGAHVPSWRFDGARSGRRATGRLRVYDASVTSAGPDHPMPPRTRPVAS
jgi:hypothetical protein